jgi:ankyrin repeat protein
LSFVIPDDLTDEFTPPFDQALFDAVIANDPAAVKARLDAGVDPDQIRGDAEQKTPLVRAVKGGCHECMRLLLAAGADVHLVDPHYRSPLRIALHRHDAEAARILLEHGADPLFAAASTRANGTDYNSVVTDIDVAEEGDPALAQTVIEASHKFQLCRLLRETPASKPNDIAAITALLDKGCPIDIKDENDRTALMYACIDKDFPLVKLLLDRGANPNVTMHDGDCTALHFACGDFREPNLDVIRILLEHGADPHKVSKQGRTLIHCAARSRNEGVMKLLVEKGVSPLMRDKRGMTPAEAYVRDQMGKGDDVSGVMTRVEEWHHNVIDMIAHDATQLKAPVQPLKKLHFAPKKSA